MTKIYGLKKKNGKIRYVGRTTKTLRYRLLLHKSAKYNQNIALYVWVQGYTDIVLLEECYDKLAYSKEREWVMKYICNDLFNQHLNPSYLTGDAKKIPKLHLRKLKYGEHGKWFKLLKSLKYKREKHTPFYLT